MLEVFQTLHFNEVQTQPGDEIMLEKQSVFGLAQSSKLQLGFQGLSLTLYSSPH